MNTRILLLSALLFAVAVPAQELLEIRPLATTGGAVDLTKERVRLSAWLNVRGNRESVRRDAGLVRLFNGLRAEQGGPLASTVRWYPRRLRPDPVDPKRWQARDRSPSTVSVFDDADYEAGPRPGKGSLVELMPVDVGSAFFTAADLKPDSIRVDDTELGAGLFYELKPERAAAYGDWTEKRKNQRIAMLVRGEILSTPTVISRVAGAGVISGLGRDELAKLALDLKRVGAPEAATGETKVVITKGLEVEEAKIPASADPEDIRAMQGAQAMLAAERRLKELLKSGKIEGIERILTFEEISAWPYEDGLKGMPKSIHKLDGKKVLMTGFMLPIDEVENIKEFLIVQSLWSCCYGQPPDINGIVRVVMKGKSRIDYQFDPIKVIGTFQVEAAFEDGYCVDIYQLHADSVEVLK